MTILKIILFANFSHFSFQYFSSIFISSRLKVKNNFEFNKKDIKACHHFLKKISKDLGLKEAITLTHIQNGIQSSLVKDRGSPHIQKYLKNLLDQALTALIAMRKKEGIYLKNQL